MASNGPPLSKRPSSPSSALDPAMADKARCTPLHPENMDATCSDVRELLAPTSFHVVHGGLHGGRSRSMVLSAAVANPGAPDPPLVHTSIVLPAPRTGP